MLVRVCAVGFCGADLAIAEGTLPYVRTGLMRYPVVPGHDWAGRGAAVGPAVGRIRSGRRVTAECHIRWARCRLCRDGRYNLCPQRARVGLIGLDGACDEALAKNPRGEPVLVDVNRLLVQRRKSE